MITRNLILIPKLNNLLLHSDFQEHHLVANKTLRLVAWVISGKALLQRVSESRVSLLSHSRRKGTISHYELACRKRNNWCYERTLVPIRCDVNPALEFMTQFLHSGLEDNTICTYRFAISAHHEAVGPFVFGKHSRLSDLMTGVFSSA